MGVKNNAGDALAIAEAANQPKLHPISVKSLEQQDIQTLMRIRTRHQDARQDVANQLRRLLAEDGIIFSKGIENVPSYHLSAT